MNEMTTLDEALAAIRRQTKDRKEVMGKDYARKTYGSARFHVCDGFYTIEELEAFLVAFRAAQVVRSAALARSMEPL